MTSDKLFETPAPACSVSYTDKQPPPFGHQLLEYFSFDPRYINLNHGSLSKFLIVPSLADDSEWGDASGSYGSIPIPVSQACKIITDEVERNPDKFIRLTYEAQWIRCRERIASLIGGHVDECVLVPNTTIGVNTVLWNIEWKKGDVIIKSAVLFALPRAVTKVFSSERNIRRRRQNGSLHRGYQPTRYFRDDSNWSAVYTWRNFQGL